MMTNKTKQQLAVLFSSDLIVLFTGMGLFPILPLYAAELDASPEQIGLFYAVIYFSLAAGSMVVNQLVRRFSRRTVYILVGAMAVPALFLMGQVNAFWQLIVLTSIVWFSGGINLSLTSILTGMHTRNGGRGKSFGLMAVAAPLGSLIGGLVIGPIVEWRGYTFLFIVMALVWAIKPLIGVFLLKDVANETTNSGKISSGNRSTSAGLHFGLILGMLLLAAVGISAVRLGTPMTMKAMHFSASSVGSTGTISGLIAIPVVLLLGTLSDRLGRRRMLVLAYMLATAGSVVLSFSNQVWQFWMASALMMIAFTANGALGSALAADMLSDDQMQVGMTRVRTVNSASGIVSFAGTGVLIGMLGAQNLFLIIGLLPVAAIGVLELTRHLGEIPGVQVSVPLQDHNPACV